MAPARKGRGRPKAAPAKVTKVTKTKPSARRVSDRLTPKNKAAAGKRKVLGDRTNRQNDSDTEEVDEFEQNEDVSMEGDELGGKEAAVAAKKPTKAKRGAAKQPKVAEEIPTAKSNSNTGAVEEPRQSRATKKKVPARVEVPEEVSPEKVVPETQVAAMEVDTPTDGEEVQEVMTTKTSGSALSRSIPRQPQPSQRARAGSASDTERSDPNLRRKLGELMKKYDMLNTRYQDLREIGLKEAERNFEKLRKQTEEKSKISNELIAALKTDLAAQTSLAKDSQALKSKVDSQAADMAKFQAQISQLTTLLSESQIENKALSAKLAANRTATASVESANAKVAGSAVKAGGVIRMMGSAEAAQVAQAAQLKEDLYSDLTGLIMRSVKRDAEEDVFDCIQTGRNGTLHFKLAVGNEKSADSYEDAQCVYVPQLDPSRDKSLMEMLPEYLVDEITFPRSQAAKFYARVVKALTEKTA